MNGVIIAMAIVFHLLYLFLDKLINIDLKFYLFYLLMLVQILITELHLPPMSELNLLYFPRLNDLLNTILF